MDLCSYCGVEDFLFDIVSGGDVYLLVHLLTWHPCVLGYIQLHLKRQALS